VIAQVLGWKFKFGELKNSKKHANDLLAFADWKFIGLIYVRGFIFD
jgi:hypothetical protein